jgi:hypothetical protein
MIIILIVLSVLFAISSSFFYRKNNGFVFAQSSAMGAMCYFYGLSSENYMFEYNLMMAIAMIAINLFVNLFAHFALFFFNSKNPAVYWIALALFLIANTISVFIYFQIMV